MKLPRLEQRSLEVVQQEKKVGGHLYRVRQSSWPEHQPKRGAGVRSNQ
jgi:hypothetical protein